MKPSYQDLLTDPPAHSGAPGNSPGGDSEFSNNGPPAAASALLAAVAQQQAESPLVVDLVDEADAMPSMKAKAPDYARLIASARRALGPSADVLTDEQLHRLCQVKVVMPGSGRQRKLPKFATPTSAEIAIWRDNRTLDQFMADCLKGCRNDGGILGAAGKFEKIAVEAGAEPTVAKVIADGIRAEMQQRIFEIRVNVAATLNEIRRDLAVKDGINSATIKYFKVVGD